MVHHLCLTEWLLTNTVHLRAAMLLFQGTLQSLLANAHRPHIMTVRHRNAIARLQKLLRVSRVGLNEQPLAPHW
jgi:hypothetical protein